MFSLLLYSLEWLIIVPMGNIQGRGISVLGYGYREHLSRKRVYLKTNLKLTPIKMLIL